MRGLALMVAASAAFAASAAAQPTPQLDPEAPFAPHRAEPALSLAEAALCVRRGKTEGLLPFPPLKPADKLTDADRADLKKLLEENNRRTVAALSKCLTERQAWALGRAEFFFGIYGDECRVQRPAVLASPMDPTYGDTDLTSAAAHLAMDPDYHSHKTPSGPFFVGQFQSREDFRGKRPGTAAFGEVCAAGMRDFGPRGVIMPGLIEPKTRAR